MMRPFGLLCIIMSVLLAGCVKNEFTVSVELPGEVDKAYPVVYYASDPEKGFLMEGALSVQQGKGHLKGITRLPTLVYVYGNRSQAPVVAYVERGDEIKITGESGNPLEWKLSGNKITDALTEWRLANRSLLEPGADKAGLNAAIEARVKKFPDSPVSALILALYFSRREDPASYDRLLRLLKGNAAESKWQMLVARGDVLEASEKAFEFPKSVVLRTIENGCDTVRFKDQPVLLFFSDTSRGDYSDYIQELRKLSRELNDSSKRIIVNINIDSDSLACTAAMRRDSLNKSVRAWAPLGLSGPEAVSLGVRRIPWIIVTDSRGKRVYQGTDMKAAAEKLSGK